MAIVTLLTDFGTEASYAAEMKAVLRARTRARLVDITHEIPPHDVVAGAFVLAAAVRAFPVGTVHLAVVDPGVGTERRPIVVRAGGHRFVGPDNGLLLPAARAVGDPRGAVIDEARFGRQPIAATFHGRDLFAPVAAALADGLPADRVGPPAGELADVRLPPPLRTTTRLAGHVAFIDRFGNAVTSLPGAWLDDAPPLLRLVRPGRPLALRRVRTYGDGRPGELLVLVGSAGTVELAVNAGRAADRLGLRPGDRIELELGPRPRPRRSRFVA